MFEEASCTVAIAEKIDKSCAMPVSMSPIEVQKACKNSAEIAGMLAI